MRRLGLISALVMLFGATAMAGDMESFEIKDLQDGETRELGDADHKVSATRDGDTVTITVEDEDGEDRTITVNAVEGDGKIMMIRGGDHQKFVVRTQEGGDENKEIKVITKAGAFGEADCFFVGGGGEGFSWVSKEGGSMLRCPEGDVTMMLEEGDSGSYYCPKHNVELEEAKGNSFHHKTIVIEKDESE